MGISVIVPAHNEEEYLGKTLESVKSQSFRDFEIIVVCNGCSDKSAEIAKRYADKVFNLKEANVSKAKNFGADKAKNGFLVFLDADVVLSKDVLEEVDKVLSEGKFYGTVKGKGKGFRNANYLRFKNLVNKFRSWNQGCMYCDKKSFFEVGGFNSGLKRGELRDFFKRAEGRYKRLRVYVEPSDRRVKEWGLWKITLYWLLRRDKKEEYEVIR